MPRVELSHESNKSARLIEIPKLNQIQNRNKAHDVRK